MWLNFLFAVILNLLIFSNGFTTPIELSVEEEILHQYLAFLDVLGRNASVIDTPRLIAFSKSFHFVANSNRINHNFKLEVNRFADIPEEELVSFFPTIKFDLPHSSATVNNSTFLSRKLDSDVILHINWASSDNPYRAPTVAPVRNQGACGACWAFVAADAIESSIATNTGHRIAISVQEFIDCDTLFNHGCSGGNPVNAFSYAITAGVSPWRLYPFTGKNNICVDPPKEQIKGSITGYVRIPPSEVKSLIDLLSLGPIATGICGTSPSFIFYSKGVLDDETCCTVQNHAILIVGFGHDPVLQLDYYVIKNSWGTAWGEQGFGRIKRTPENGTGICGMTLNPSMPYGGYLMNYDEHANLRNDSKYHRKGDGSENSYGYDDDLISNDPSSNHHSYHGPKLSDIPWKTYITWFEIWIMDNWQVLMIVCTLVLLLVSIIMLVYSMYLECCLPRLPSRTYYRALPTDISTTSWTTQPSNSIDPITTTRVVPLKITTYPSQSYYQSELA